MKKLLIGFAALVVLSLPNVAFADTITLTAPPTAPDAASNIDPAASNNRHNAQTAPTRLSLLRP